MTYLITPAVVFYGALKADLHAGNLFLPVILFVFGCLSASLFFYIGKIFWKDRTKNILAFAAGTGNNGYFGIPVAAAIFGQQTFPIMIMASFRLSLNENSLGFFFAAKGRHTTRESLIKASQLPTFYAFLLGVILNNTDINLAFIYPTLGDFKGDFSLLGMLLIEISIAGIQKVAWDWRFIALAFLTKFAVFPLGILGIIMLDQARLHIFNPQTYGAILMLIACKPLVSNTVAVAVEMDAHPKKVPLTVLLSTIFALFYIPFIMIWII